MKHLKDPTDEERALWGWLSRPAQWWQFWLPQSGWLGGLIGFCVIRCVLMALGIIDPD